MTMETGQQIILINSYHAILLSSGTWISVIVFPLHLYGESACQLLIVVSAYSANHSTTQHFLKNSGYQTIALAPRFQVPTRQWPNL